MIASDRLVSEESFIDPADNHRSRDAKLLRGRRWRLVLLGPGNGNGISRSRLNRRRSENLAKTDRKNGLVRTRLAKDDLHFLVFEQRGVGAVFVDLRF